LKISILQESSITLALYGLGLSHGLTSNTTFEEFCLNTELQERLYEVALKLAPKGKGHNKFLESIQVWLELQLPRYIWQDFSTYRVGISTQSEATNHTITKRILIQEDFDAPIPDFILEEVNRRIVNKDLIGVKDILPESFLQKRVLNVNYKCLQNILTQRKNHKLPQFQIICKYLHQNLKYRELLKDA